MKYGYCLGIRVTSDFMERICQNREGCAYYLNTRLSDALSHPEKYEEIDTYNDKECNLHQR